MFQSLGASGGDGNTQLGYSSESQHAAVAGSVMLSFSYGLLVPTGTSAVMRSDVGVEGDGLINDPNDGGQNGSPSTATGQATVYIETDGVGHVYIEVDGTVFSYGRYNGSYSPSSGQFGPYGEGVLLKKEGQDAADFINERTAKYPTNSYKIDVNTSDVYSYFNTRYEGGKPVIDKQGRVREGRVIDTYTLVGPGGNNCATIVCRGLNAGGANIGVFQSPSSLNLFLFNSNAIKNGYNPGLWGPKR